MRIGWIKGCEIKLHPLLIALVILAAWAGQLPLFMVAFGSVLYHELCHVMAAVLCGYSVTRIEVLPFGSVAQIQGLFEEQPQSEMLIALAGPAANVLMVMALTTLKHYTGLDFPYQEPFIAANLQLAVFNLLPLLPMDGGRILRSALARCVSLGKATRLAADLGILGGLAMAIAAAAGWLPGRAAMILLGLTVLLTALRERRNIPPPSAAAPVGHAFYSASLSSCDHPGRKMRSHRHPWGERGNGGADEERRKYANLRDNSWERLTRRG